MALKERIGKGYVNAQSLKIKGVAVTASAAELNALAGQGVIAADAAKLHALTPSAAQLNLAVQGVAAGYKIARGVTAITATPQTIVSGLATVVAVIVSPTTDATLTDTWKAATIGDQAGSPAAGSFIVTATKPTSNIDGTPIAATTPWRPVNWVAFGT